MIAKRNRSTFLIATCILPVGILGCPALEPPPESVLAGTWELTSTEAPSQLDECIVTFNSFGHIAQVKFTLVDERIITWNNPPSAVTVEGDQISVSATPGDSELTFVGTLDSETEPTRAEGEITINATFGDVTISETGEAMLVKQ